MKKKNYGVGSYITTDGENIFTVINENETQLCVVDILTNSFDILDKQNIKIELANIGEIFIMNVAKMLTEIKVFGEDRGYALKEIQKYSKLLYMDK